MCQDQNVLIVDITGTVATIAEEVLENRERIDKINDKLEKVEKITLSSIDRKLNTIISTLSMLKQDQDIIRNNLIEHGSSGLRLIEVQLTGMYIIII